MDVRDGDRQTCYAYSHPKAAVVEARKGSFPGGLNGLERMLADEGNPLLGTTRVLMERPVNVAGILRDKISDVSNIAGIALVNDKGHFLQRNDIGVDAAQLLASGLQPCRPRQRGVPKVKRGNPHIASLI